MCVLWYVFIHYYFSHGGPLFGDRSAALEERRKSNMFMLQYPKSKCLEAKCLARLATYLGLCEAAVAPPWPTCNHLFESWVAFAWSSEVRSAASATKSYCTVLCLHASHLASLHCISTLFDPWIQARYFPMNSQRSYEILRIKQSSELGLLRAVTEMESNKCN